VIYYKVDEQLHSRNQPTSFSSQHRRLDRRDGQGVVQVLEAVFKHVTDGGVKRHTSGQGVEFPQIKSYLALKIKVTSQVFHQHPFSQQ